MEQVSPLSLFMTTTNFWRNLISRHYSCLADADFSYLVKDDRETAFLLGPASW